jgi:hypothetical protein
MGSPRVNSPAGGAAAGGANANSRRSEDEEGVNMKEVDGLLTEMSVMLGRWALYTRFLAGRCRVRFCVVGDFITTVAVVWTESG